MRFHTVLLCITLTFCILSVYNVQAFSQTFQLKSGEDNTIQVYLDEGDQVSGRITVVGIQDSTINFSVIDSEENAIVSIRNVGLRDFEFKVEEASVYRFRFENYFSEETKHVTFNYNIQQYIFGFPQEFIILFAIVGIAVIAVIVFIAMSPKP